MRPWILAEQNYGDLKHQPIEVAVLPTGATEPHNLHLPYGTDTYQVEALADGACERAWRAGHRVIMLPPIPYGTETNLLPYPLAMNLHPSTLALVLKDLIASLAAQQIRKLVIVNGHGGNDFKPTLRELQYQTPVHLFLCDWFKGLSADLQKQIFEAPGDHAGEMETSLIMHCCPDLVQFDPETGRMAADAGSVRSTRFPAVDAGWISLTRPFSLLTTNSGVGNPHPATAEKGARLMSAMIDRLSGFLIDLARTPIDPEFPYAPRAADSADQQEPDSTTGF